MSARFAAGLCALLLLAGCSSSRTLSDPRLDPGQGDSGTAGLSSGSLEDLAATREAGELVGAQDDATGYLEDLIERRSVLVDTLNVAHSDVPDISDSLAAATEARMPSVEEIFDYPVVVNRRVLTWIDVYTGGSRTSFQRSLIRSGKYLPMARRIFAEEGVPQDLTFLGHVESGFRFNARSHARALGLWQFMRGTAGDLGLRCDERVDERLDPEKSTRACARYLRQLYERYDDWLLAIAAYNTGPGNVDRAMRKAESRDFWELARQGHLLNETRNFVPAILAATILAKSPAAYGFSEETDPPLAYDTIRVDHIADLRVVARVAGATEEELRGLNPALLAGQTPGAHGYEVRVPMGTGERASARLAEIPPADLVEVIRHKVKSGDTLGGLAKRYGTSVRAIQEANGLGRSTMIRAGKTLRIPSRGTPAALFVQGELGAKTTATAASGPASTHKVRKGETVSSIARRYGVSVNALAQANRLLDPSRIQPGQTLEIPGQRLPVAADRAEVAEVAGAGGSVTESVPVGAGDSETAPSEVVDEDLANEFELALVESGLPLGRGESTAHLVDQARAELALADESPISLAAVQGTAKDVPSAGALPARVYKVRPGDTLYGIAGKNGVRIDDLLAWNGINKGAVIRPGQLLRLDGSGVRSTGSSPTAGDEFRLHVVVPGDTLWQIARSYGVNVSDLRRWNGLKSRSRIYPGQKLRVF
ncbi:MAG: LysM peptidoglycan-binding domain-containing protein [Candidatus Eisenbacteria bacterium]